MKRMSFIVAASFASAAFMLGTPAQAGLIGGAGGGLGGQLGGAGSIGGNVGIDGRVGGSVARPDTSRATGAVETTRDKTDAARDAAVLKAGEAKDGALAKGAEAKATAAAKGSETKDRATQKAGELRGRAATDAAVSGSARGEANRGGASADAQGSANVQR
jgi:hypothetical protein